jgi:pectinesterase
MNRLLILFAAAACSIAALAQTAEKKTSYKDWVREAPRFTDEFMKSDEAARIAENVLLYQHTTGGWPKNIRMQNVLSDADRAEALKQKNDVNESTIDNDATTTEVRFLIRMYNATGVEKYREAAIDGMRYILKSQYDNGGWPQFYPRDYGYYTHITYNDNAMINVMKMLRDVINGVEPYTSIPDTIRHQAEKALDKGIECILNTQVRVNGKLTVWCAQHDEKTLEPAPARAYELPSLSGQESDDIVIFLMSIPDPSQRVVEAIEAAVAWFKEARIDGIKKEYFTGADGKRDFRMVKAADSTPLWARFYDIESGKPFFCDRDGIKRSDISEIGYERRNGYSWYNNHGLDVLKRYDKWKAAREKAGK